MLLASSVNNSIPNSRFHLLAFAPARPVWIGRLAFPGCMRTLPGVNLTHSLAGLDWAGNTMAAFSKPRLLKVTGVKGLSRRPQASGANADFTKKGVAEAVGSARPQQTGFLLSFRVKSEGGARMWGAAEAHNTGVGFHTKSRKNHIHTTGQHRSTNIHKTYRTQFVQQWMIDR